MRRTVLCLVFPLASLLATFVDAAVIDPVTGLEIVDDTEMVDDTGVVDDMFQTDTLGYENPNVLPQKYYRENFPQVPQHAVDLFLQSPSRFDNAPEHFRKAISLVMWNGFLMLPNDSPAPKFHWEFFESFEHPTEGKRLRVDLHSREAVNFFRRFPSSVPSNRRGDNYALKALFSWMSEHETADEFVKSIPPKADEVSLLYVQFPQWFDSKNMKFWDDLYANENNYDLFEMDSRDGRMYVNKVYYFYEGATKHYRKFPEKFPRKVHWRLFSYICEQIDRAIAGAFDNQWNDVSGNFLIHFAHHQNRNNVRRVRPLVNYLMKITSFEDTPVRMWRSSKEYRSEEHFQFHNHYGFRKDSVPDGYL